MDKERISTNCIQFCVYKEIVINLQVIGLLFGQAYATRKNRFMSFVFDEHANIQYTYDTVVVIAVALAIRFNGCVFN